MADKSPSDKAFEERVRLGGHSVHDNFQRQVQKLLADKKLSEEDRQKILTNMSCPCCGGAAASFAVKLDD